MTWKILTCVSCCLLSSSVIGQDVDELLSISPDDANSIVVVHMHKLIASPLGQQQGWAERQHDAYLNGTFAIPPWVRTLVRSSHVRPEAFGGDWTSFAVHHPDGFEMQTVAHRWSSEVQSIARHPVVYAAKRNGYFVDFGPAGKKVLGGLAPASRQQVAKWIEDVADRTQPELSGYLVSSAEAGDAQIILAIDLDEMLDPVQIRYRLSGTKSLEDRNRERIELTLDLQSLQGIRMEIEIGTEMQARIRFDFQRSVGEEARFVKELLIEYLNDAGAALDELNSAEVTIADKQATLTFVLTQDSLERILSLVTASAPPSAAGLATTTPQPPEPGGSSAVDQDASLRYYRAVNRNVDSMEKAYRRINNYRQTARWHDTYAQRIEELSITGVDPELLDYGQKMSSLLRALGASLRGMGVNVDALNQQITYNVEQKPIYYNGADWWWGGAHTIYGPYTYGRPMETKVETNLQDVRAKQAEVVANTQPEREKIWQMINEERSVTRRAMVAKYGKDFER